MTKKFLHYMIAMLAVSSLPTLSSATACNNSTECAPGTYCAKPIGDCGGAGVCMTQHSMCYQVWAPVCGCDDHVYSSDGCAATAGVNVAYYGECLPVDCIDTDRDGYAISGGDCGPIDCNDSDWDISPEAPEVCTNKIDDDCDTFIDSDDADCFTSSSNLETGKSCRDRIDNDHDGLVDGMDPDCGAIVERKKEGYGLTCSDRIDNDGDGQIDCDDLDCEKNKSCRLK